LKKHSLKFLLIFFLFLNFKASASSDFFSLEETNYYIPTLQEISPDRYYHLGHVKLANEEIPIQVTLKVRKNSEDNCWWNLYFWHPERLGKNGKQFGVLHFHVYDENTCSFKGMLIDEKYRAHGLSKVLFKFFVAFASYNNRIIVSEKIYKPMFCKMLTDCKMVPDSDHFMVSICKPNGGDNCIMIYPHGDFRFRDALMKSQKMKYVEEEPAEDACQKVAVYTSYSLPSEEDLFWQKIQEFPGEITIYRRH